MLQTGRHRGLERLGNRLAIADAEPLVELRAESAAALALAVEEGTVDAGPGAVAA